MIKIEKRKGWKCKKYKFTKSCSSEGGDPEELPVLGERGGGGLTASSSQQEKDEEPGLDGDHDAVRELKQDWARQAV